MMDIRNTDELLDQLCRSRERIARLESVIRCMRAGRKVDIPAAIQMAQAVEDSLAEREAISRISAWLPEGQIWEALEVFQDEVAEWPTQDPELVEQVTRILKEAAEQQHEWTILERGK